MPDRTPENPPPLRAPAPDHPRFPLPHIVATLEAGTHADHPAMAFGLLRGEHEIGLAATTFVDHPAAALIGFAAPHEWDAIAIVARGHDLGARRRGVRMAFAMDRGGRQAAVIRDLGTGECQEPEGEAVGRLADVCSRVLGLATPPPELSVDQLLHHVWLERVLRPLIAEPEHIPHWGDLVAHHPAGSLAGPGASPSSLHDATARLAEELTWADLRHDGIDGSYILSPTLVSWFDDGSYCRWVLADLPILDDLIADAVALLPARVVTPLLETLAVAACS